MADSSDAAEKSIDVARVGSPWVVGVLSIAVFMSSLDLFIVNLAFPYLAREFHGADLSSLSWVLNAYSVIFAAVLVPAGRWADKVGRRRVFVLGLVVFSLGSMGSALSTSVLTLIATRVIQAIGAGMMVPASLSILLAAVPAAKRPQAIGTWSAFGALGAALGPVIGGCLVEVSWRLVFWINVPVGIVAVVLTLRVLPESTDDDARHNPDIVGAVLLGLGVGIVALALVKAPAWGLHSLSMLVLVILGCACLAGVVAQVRRHPAPIVDRVLLQSRSFNGAFLASVLYYAAFGAFVLNSVEFLTTVWHFSPIEAGLALAPGPLTVLPFARLVAPRLARIFGNAGRVAALGCTLNAAAQLWWWSQMGATSAYATHMLPAQLLSGIGVGLTIPSLIAAGTTSLPAARFGTGSGVLNMGRQIGTVLGVATLIAVLTKLSSLHPVPTFRHGVLLVVGFFVSAAVVSALVLARVPRQPRLSLASQSVNARDDVNGRARDLA